MSRRVICSRTEFLAIAEIRYHELAGRCLAACEISIWRGDFARQSASLNEDYTKSLSALRPAREALPDRERAVMSAPQDYYFPSGRAVRLLYRSH